MLPDGPGGIWVVFQPLLVGALIGSVVAVAAMGYASLRTLRGQPHFAHKVEMLWGARWSWAVLAGFIGLQQWATYTGSTLTSYSMTIAGGSAILLGGALWVLVWRWLPWQMEGCGLPPLVVPPTMLVPRPLQP